MSGLTVNGAAITLSSNSLSAIDTGTTLIAGPRDDVRSFYNAIPGSVNLSNIDPEFAGYFGYRMLEVPLVPPLFFILANMLSSAQLAVQMFPYRYPLEDNHGQSTPWTSMQVHCNPIILYALAPSSTLGGAVQFLRKARNTFSEICSWYVIYYGSTLLLHIFFLEKCVYGAPFLPTVCWVCSIVSCGWWIRCTRARTPRADLRLPFL